MAAGSRDLALAALGLGLLALALFGDVLLLPGDLVASKEYGDAAYYFARVRRLGFAEIAAGNLPLWNPYVFSGHPLLATFQPALLYPPNAIYLLLPLAKALDADLAGHVFLTGLFTFLWVRGRGLHPLGAFFAGALASLAGATSLRVMAGQVSLVAANAWTPLVLLAVDRLLARPTPGWCLLGIAAATLQILAGYPFCAFATALIAALTAALEIGQSPQRGRSALALAAMALAPVLLSAAQLLPGLALGTESTRAGGVSLWFATTFSLPLENLATALVPDLFGDLQRLPYWGDEWFWDASIFLGAPALTLAALGLARGAPEHTRSAAFFVLLLTLLALGDATPLYTLFHAWVPGFDRFRAPSKFAFHATLFVGMLAATGLDALWREARGARPAALALGVAAALLGVTAAILPGLADEGEPWSRLLRAVGGASVYTEAFSRQSAGFAALGIARLAGASALLALLLALRPGRRWTVLAIAGLGVAELFAYARVYRGAFSLSDLARPEVEAFYRAHPGDHRFYFYRHRAESAAARLAADGELPLDEREFLKRLAEGNLDLTQANRAMDLRVRSIWGYDPVQQRRYARFVASLMKGEPVAGAPANLAPPEPHPRFALLRCRWVIDADGPVEIEAALPRFLLMREFEVASGDAVLAAVTAPDFDPRRTLWLESAPEPAPDPDGRGGSVAVLDESTDHVTLEVELADPAILLVTDGYASGWRAVPAAPGDARRYRLLPADFVLRAVPLAAGHHRLRLEYAPPAYRLGRWISLASGVAFLGGLAWVGLRGRRRRA